MRHSTLSPYAAFNTKTGERHTSAEFVAFLTDIVINQPRGKEIHVITDNLPAHKSQTVKDLCVFRPMPGQYSGASRAGIPVHAGPPFRRMPAGVSEAG